MMKFEPIADRDKFIVVYPEADQDLRWDLAGTHDVDFMVAIIDDMSARYGIDLDRVYASGFSMGGMFSYTLACKLPEKIAAIAPGDGYPLGGESGCTKTRPVPIFHMHGTADDFVKYSGIHAFLDKKVAEYGCPSTAVTTKPYPPTKADSQSFKEYWGPCVNAKGQASEIVLISVAGMIHDWATAGKANANTDPQFAGKPFDIDGSEEAWAFLKTHSLADAGSTGSGGAHAIDGTGGLVAAGTGGTFSTGAGGTLVGVSGETGAGGITPVAVGSALPQGVGGTLLPGSGGVSLAYGGATANSTDSKESSGCSCAVARAARRSTAGLGLVLGLALLRRLRIRPRATARRSRPLTS
jgi:dienelactone hydrolase